MIWFDTWISDWNRCAIEWLISVDVLLVSFASVTQQLRHSSVGLGLRQNAIQCPITVVRTLESEARALQCRTRAQDLGPELPNKVVISDQLPKILSSTLPERTLNSSLCADNLVCGSQVSAQALSGRVRTGQSL